MKCSPSSLTGQGLKLGEQNDLVGGRTKAVSASLGSDLHTFSTSSS